MALLTQEPGSFSGKFGEALDKYQLMVDDIASGKLVPTPDDLETLVGVSKATNKKINEWKTQVNSIFGGSNDPFVSDMLTSLNSLISDLCSAQSCIQTVQNKPVTPCNGPCNDDFFFDAANCLSSVSGDNSAKARFIGVQRKYSSLMSVPELDAYACDASEFMEANDNKFIAPNGKIISLSKNVSIITEKSINKGGDFYPQATSTTYGFPNGTLIAFSENGVTFVAQLEFSGKSTFIRYLNYDSWLAFSKAPTTFGFDNVSEYTGTLTDPLANKQPQNVFAVYSGNGYRSLSKKEYAYTGLRAISNEIIEESEFTLTCTNDCKNLLNCLKDSPHTDSPPGDGYSNNLADLQSKLEHYNLGDVVFKITDKDGKVSFVDRDKTYPNGTAPPNVNGKTVFEIKEDADGKVDVSGNFKPDPTCPNCAGAAQTALNAALDNIKTKHGGKVDPAKNAIESSDYTQIDGLAYQNMSLGEMLAALAKGYNSLVQEAKVPEDVWKPEQDFPVKDGWGVITGAIDGAIVEGTDKAQLVGLVLTVVSNPKKTATDVAGFAKGVVTDWDKTKELIASLGQGIIGYNPANFEEGKDPVYKGRGIGEVGGTLAVQAATGGMVFLTIFKKASGELDDLAVRIARALERLKAKLRSFDWSDTQVEGFATKVENWTDTDIERLLDDLETDKSIFEGFRDGKFDLEASKTLVLDIGGITGKNLRRVHKNLTTLSNIREILPSRVTMDDIKDALKSDRVTNKGDFLDQLSDFDASNIDQLEDFLKKRSLRNYAVEKGPVSYSGVPNADVQDIVANRQAKRQASQDLDIADPDYTAKYKDNMKDIIEGSEKAAEAMADLHFGKTNFIDLSLPGAGKQGQFDKVYRDANGNWSIVECKGGASELGSRAGNQQCTRAYIDSIIENLESKAGSLRSEQIAHLAELKAALRQGEVKNYLLKQPFNVDGSLGTTKLTEYNL